MPLPLPNLDTRRWADLVDEGRALVPRYAPGWTDHNYHDPGITLLELLAWLVEQDVYRTNRVPERHVRKFLQLAGVAPEPPRAARVALSFALKSSAAPLVLPAGAILAGSARDASPVLFRTRRRVRVVHTRIAAVQTWDGTRYADVTRLAQEQVPFPPLGVAPTGFDGNAPPALLLGFDEALPICERISLWLTVAGGDRAPHVVRELLAETAAQAEACRPASPRRTCGDIATRVPHARPPAARPALHTIWELFDGSEWRRVAALDETRGLTLDGVVQLWTATTTTAVRLGDVPDALHWVRCRAAHGVPDEAPVLLDVALNAVPAVQRVPVRQTLPLTAADAAAHTLVLALDPHLRSDTTVLVGAGRGLPEQQLKLPGAPVADGELRLWSVEDGTAYAWAQRLDFDAATGATRAFVLDAEAGVLRFGDGAHGRVPPLGAQLFAVYETTDAGGGNVDTASSWQLVEPSDDLESIASRGPARGGAAAEDVVHASGRAAEALWAHERLLELAPDPGSTLDGLDPATVGGRVAPPRATTTLDFERLALAVPGRRIRRARAWAGLDAAAPGLHAPGTVSVVVVNGYPADRPQPSESLLAAVRGYLQRRKTLGTRLVVSGPTYVEVTVTATVRPLAGADASALQDRVATRLARFLDPLTGGPSGLGWPFGRDVYRTELLALVDAIDGVDSVEALTLATSSGDVGCGNVCVGPADLVVSGAHVVEVAG